MQRLASTFVRPGNFRDDAGAAQRTSGSSCVPGSSVSAWNVLHVKRVFTFRINLKRAVALYYDYANELCEDKRVDFAHLQGHFVEFLESPQAQLFLEGDGTPSRPGVSNVLVDEYQDTNPIQEMVYFDLASSRVKGFVEQHVVCASV